MASMFIPFIVLFVIIYGLYKKIDIYNAFIKGVEEGIDISIKLFSVIFSMTLCINILMRSNIINDISDFLRPVFSFFHYPSDLFPLAVMRPISSSSSLIIMNNILKSHGVDSFIGRVASVLQGSTDTTIYILGLYFSSVGIKKTKYALIVGLLADLMAVIFSFLIVKILYN